MKSPTFTRFMLAATLAVIATTANAHDPSEFDRMMNQPKPVPTTCLELADFQNFLTDLRNPEVKALKSFCDVQVANAAKKQATRVVKPAPSKIK